MSAVEYVRVVFWHQHFSTCTLTWSYVCHWTAIGQPSDSHRMQNKGVGVSYLHDTKLVGNHRTLQFETLITDLEYADDMALLAYSWNNLEAMFTSLQPTSVTSVCPSAVRRPRPWQSFHPASVHHLRQSIFPPSSLCPPPVPIHLSFIHLSPIQPPVESVTSFQYLGSIVQDDCGSDL